MQDLSTTLLHSGAFYEWSGGRGRSVETLPVSLHRKGRQQSTHENKYRWLLISQIYGIRKTSRRVETSTELTLASEPRLILMNLLSPPAPILDRHLIIPSTKPTVFRPVIRNPRRRVRSMLYSMKNEFTETFWGCRRRQHCQRDLKSVNNRDRYCHRINVRERDSEIPPPW